MCFNLRVVHGCRLYFTRASQTTLYRFPLHFNTDFFLRESTVLLQHP